MYPYLYLFGIKLPMTGLGVLVGLATFIIAMWYYCKKFGLQFNKVFFWIPILLITTYFGGSIVSFWLDSGGIKIIPTSRLDIVMIISPYGYRFHYVGIVFGIVWSIRHLFGEISTSYEKIKWIDALLLSTTIALIPVGLFFLLGDNFIGKQIESGFGVTAIHAESKLTAIGKVIPLGIYLSLGSALIFASITALKGYSKRFGYGYLGFFLVLLMMHFLLLFQQYPRHLVMEILGGSRDIKNFVSLLLGVICLGNFLIINLKKN